MDVNPSGWSSKGRTGGRTQAPPCVAAAPWTRSAGAKQNIYIYGISIHVCMRYTVAILAQAAGNSLVFSSWLLCFLQVGFSAEAQEGWRSAVWSRRGSQDDRSRSRRAQTTLIDQKQWWATASRARCPNRLALCGSVRPCGGPDKVSDVGHREHHLSQLLAPAPAVWVQRYAVTSFSSQPSVRPTALC